MRDDYTRGKGARNKRGEVIREVNLGEGRREVVDGKWIVR